jgi:hypothetical protein
MLAALRCCDAAIDGPVNGRFFLQIGRYYKCNNGAILIFRSTIQGRRRRLTRDSA